jgi:hypothetical protein
MRVCEHEVISTLIFNCSYLYAPALEAPEARLLAAIALEHCSQLFETKTQQAFLNGAQQAFLYGEMGPFNGSR